MHYSPPGPTRGTIHRQSAESSTTIISTPLPSPCLSLSPLRTPPLVAQASKRKDLILWKAISAETNYARLSKMSKNWRSLAVARRDRHDSTRTGPPLRTGSSECGIWLWRPCASDDTLVDVRQQSDDPSMYIRRSPSNRIPHNGLQKPVPWCFEIPGWG